MHEARRLRFTTSRVATTILIALAMVGLGARMSFVNRHVGAAAVLLLAGSSQLAAADPLVARKVQTIPIHSGEMSTTPQTSSAVFPDVHSPDVHMVTVRPRDGSGPPPSASQGASNLPTGADLKAIRTLPVRLGPAAIAHSPDQQLVRSIRVPAQDVSQEPIEGARAAPVSASPQ
jgi:hypothetical protein